MPTGMSLPVWRVDPIDRASPSNTMCVKEEALPGLDAWLRELFEIYSGAILSLAAQKVSSSCLSIGTRRP